MLLPKKYKLLLINPTSFGRRLGCVVSGARRRNCRAVGFARRLVSGERGEAAELPRGRVREKERGRVREKARDRDLGCGGTRIDLTP